MCLKKEQLNSKIEFQQLQEYEFHKVSHQNRKVNQGILIHMENILQYHGLRHLDKIWAGNDSTNLFHLNALIDFFKYK